jgi:seryl-tRNA synthetase
MLYIPYVYNNRDAVVRGLQKKGFPDAEGAVANILALDQKRKIALVLLQDHQSEINKASAEIGALRKKGDINKAQEEQQRVQILKEQVKEEKDRLSRVEAELEQLLVTIPNVPHASVPEGRSADDNEVVLQHGQVPQLAPGALPHWELIKKYDIIDFELGTKISGAGFPVYKGKGARLQRAMINFFLDQALRAGYTEIQPPIVVNEASGFGTGQLPDKEGQMYGIPEEKLYLIPTAEVPITNLYRDVILEAKDLPVKNVGYTPCFRREAGSWGAHVRGLNRLHQFDKVELVRIETPERSYEALEEMVQHVRGLLEQLELPYRLLKLCGGDMSFTAALGYDLEVYSAAQGRWLEVSSVSNFETFQANRLKLRYRDENKKTSLLHTLNGSALALPRILAALLENNQSENGITIPEVLRPYTGFDRIG